jgi:hypothetical protein
MTTREAALPCPAHTPAFQLLRRWIFVATLARVRSSVAFE